MFGVVQLRQGHIDQMKRNWTQGRSVAILLDIRSVLADLNFMIPLLDPSSRLIMQDFLRMLILGGKI